MKDKHRTKFVTKDIFKSSVIGAFTKLNPKYMMHNPVMFVVEIGFVIALRSPSSPSSSGPPTASIMSACTTSLSASSSLSPSSSPTSPRRWPRAATRPRPRA